MKKMKSLMHSERRRRKPRICTQFLYNEEWKEAYIVHPKISHPMVMGMPYVRPESIDHLGQKSHFQKTCFIKVKDPVAQHSKAQ